MINSSICHSIRIVLPTLGPFTLATTTHEKSIAGAVLATIVNAVLVSIITVHEL